MLDEIEAMRKHFHYDPDTGLFYWKVAPKYHPQLQGKLAGCIKHQGYVILKIFHKNYQAHRVAWAMFYGEFPQHGIDHVNGDRSDNRISNLRDVSPSENMRNQRLRPSSSTGITGVVRTRSGFQAQVGSLGTVQYLGHFQSLSDAAKVAMEARREMGFHENHGKPAAKATGSVLDAGNAA